MRLYFCSKCRLQVAANDYICPYCKELMDDCDYEDPDPAYDGHFGESEDGSFGPPAYSRPPGILSGKGITIATLIGIIGWMFVGFGVPIIGSIIIFFDMIFFAWILVESYEYAKLAGISAAILTSIVGLFLMLSGLFAVASILIGVVVFSIAGQYLKNL